MYKNKEYLYKAFIEDRLTVEVIAENCKVSKSTIEKWLRKFGLRRGNQIHTVNNDKINNEMSPIFSYFADLVATDGHFSKSGTRVALRLRNRGSYEVLTLIKDYIEYTGDVYVYNDCDNELSVSDKEFRYQLLNYGMSEEGKMYNNFPFIIRFLPNSEDHTRMFYRGVVDGDGNVQQNGIFRISMSNKKFMEGFSKSINSVLNLDTKVVPDRKYWKIEMTKHQSKVFLDSVYEGYPEYRLPDKYNNYVRG